ncbi:hypothetical protein ASF72_18445 [Arthrobacter sp. Leaf141]|uniref:glycerol-3-phosphate dehydrogenase/oxidase n=1 Tax=Arthrobacter sp. Leaf141 TaxID=1736273 RepID=UPI0006FFC451|nr:glycerol-3-phosphate dehydrogenase/oxidase [Arthrobacter sp. Leaf141]KQQ98423.1 hypothetical protein ASF72_18445 [Arthrobacter sp. Leaf141]
MTDLSTFLPPLVGSALGGAFVAGGFGIYSNWTAKRHEHEKWLRDQRMEAYQHFADMQGVLVYALTADWAGEGSREDVVKAFGTAQGTLDIVAPGNVRKSATALSECTSNAAQEYLFGSLKRDEDRLLAFISESKKLAEAFIQVARKDLGIDSEDYSVSGSDLDDRGEDRPQA